MFGSFDGRRLRLTIDEAGARQARFLVTQAEAVVDIVRRATGQAVTVTIEPPREESAAPDVATTPSTDAVRQHPVVRKAEEIFDAVVTDVRDRPRETSE